MALAFPLVTLALPFSCFLVITVSAEPQDVNRSAISSQSTSHLSPLLDSAAARKISERLRNFIRRVPKAELHVHIEGVLEPELMMDIAARNGLPQPYPSAEAARTAYNFRDLQSFLNLAVYGASVLRTRVDFYDLAMSYFRRAAACNVVHSEVSFGPSTHLANGLSWETFMGGLGDAAEDATAQLGMTVSYIMCFNRGRSEQEANDTLTASLPYRRYITAVGLAYSERGNPPSKFERVFARAAALGFRLAAHAGEEGPPQYVWEALKSLHVARIDHGIRSLDDPSLVAYLNATRVPLTVCPISNVKLKVYGDEIEERLTELVRSGLVVTLNSDDPGYFGADINQNFEWMAMVANLSISDVARLAASSLEAAFPLPDGDKGSGGGTARGGATCAAGGGVDSRGGKKCGGGGSSGEDSKRRRRRLLALIDQLAGEAEAEADSCEVLSPSGTSGR